VTERDKVRQAVESSGMWMSRYTGEGPATFVGYPAQFIAAARRLLEGCDRDWEKHFINTVCTECDRPVQDDGCPWRERAMVCGKIHDMTDGAVVATDCILGPSQEREVYEAARALMQSERLSREDAWEAWNQFSDMASYMGSNNDVASFVLWLQDKGNILGPCASENGEEGNG